MRALESRDVEESPQERFARYVANAETLMAANMEGSGNSWLAAYNEVLQRVNIHFYKMKDEPPEVLGPLRERMKELSREVQALQIKYPGGTVPDNVKNDLLRRLNLLAQ